MQTSIYERAASLLRLFETLRGILLAEGSREWLGHIDAIVRALTPPFESELQCKETVQEAKRRFTELEHPKGGFSEFHIRRQVFNEQLEANLKLEKIKEEISAC